MTASISTQIQEASQELIRLARTPDGTVIPALRATINRFLGWPFRADPGFAASDDGQRTENFAIVVHTRSSAVPLGEPVEIPADTLACVIDVSENLDLEQLCAA